MLLIVTLVATLAASGIVEQAQRSASGPGAGVEYRYLLLVAFVYVAWAPFAARSVTAPLRLVQRHTPGVGEFRDVYLDKRMTQFESTAVFVSALGLVAASVALVGAGWSDGGAARPAAVVIVAVAAAAWVWTLRDYAAGVGQTVSAVWLTLRGREAPAAGERSRVPPPPTR